MDKIAVKNRIIKLSQEINHLRYQYHVLDKPEVTDEVYESLMAELKGLEEQFPDLRLPDSPTQRIGGKPLDKFQKVRHLARQWSFDDVFSLEGLKKWEEKVQRMMEKVDFLQSSAFPNSSRPQRLSVAMAGAAKPSFSNLEYVAEIKRNKGDKYL